jgi:hypothetical protein
MSGIECDNCGEPMSSFDPLEPVLCEKCKMRANQISEKARKEFALFGELLRKIREQKDEDNNGAKDYK